MSLQPSALAVAVLVVLLLATIPVATRHPRSREVVVHVDAAPSSRPFDDEPDPLVDQRPVPNITSTTTRPPRASRSRVEQTFSLKPEVEVEGKWDRLARCESGGRWDIHTGNGYSGGLQFSSSTWRAHGGQGEPWRASRTEQIRVAERILATQGWGAWPACSRALGLR